MIGFRPQPSAGGTGGGGGSYDDTAIRKRLSDNEILDGVQNGAIEALEDASAAVAGRLKTLEDAPAPVPFDPAPLIAADAAVAERVAVLEAKPAPVPFDPAPLVAADADLGRRIGVIEGRPEPVPYDDTGLRDRVKALEDVPPPVPFDPSPLIAADVGFDRRLDVVEIAGAQIEDRVDILEKAPAPAPYDDAAIVARVKTLEDAPKPAPFDPASLIAVDTALGERIGAAEVVSARSVDRITALESVPIPPAFDPSGLEAADAALGRRIDTLSAEGYDDTALSGRVKALEDAPAPVPYDDAGLRGRVTDLEARPLHTPFDPAPLVAADADLGRRIGVIEGRPDPVPYDDTHLRGRVTDLEARPVHVPFDPAPLVAADDAIAERVSTLEAVPAPVPYDDAALRGRVTDLEARPVHAPFDSAPLEAADAALGARIDALSESGGNVDIEEIQSDITRLTNIAFNHGVTLGEHDGLLAGLRTDVEALEAAPAPAPYDDAALRGRVTNLEARPVHAPFDPAPLEAADAELARRIRVVEDRPASAPFDPSELIAADSNLNAAIGRVRSDLREIEDGYHRKELRPGQSVQGQSFPASLTTIGDLGLSSAADLTIYVLDDFDSVLAVHRIPARPADRIVDYLAAFPAGLRASRLVAGSDAFVNIDADVETYPTGRLVVEYGTVAEMLGLYRGPVASLDARFDAIGGGGAPYDDGPLTSRVVALEGRPAPTPFDPSALEAADRALGERIDAIGSGGAKPLVFLGAVRFLTSRTGVTLASLLPAGTTEIEIECIGGGASGKSVYAPSGTSNVVAPGGHPGGVRRSGRIRIGPTLQADILIGAGGARTLSTGNAHGPDNAGGDTTVGLYNGLTVRAEGGPSYADFTNINTGINTTTHSQYLHRLPAPQMPKPGQGHTAGNTAQRASHAADGYDAPTGGGGTVAGGGGSHGGGNGGTVYLLKSLGVHSTSKLPGGLGSTSLTDSSGDGQNHISNQPGTYGPGGGGHYWLNGSQSVSEAGSGAIPGGGGGGGVAVAGANFVQRSGAGAQGAADIYCWGAAQ